MQLLNTEPNTDLTNNIQEKKISLAFHASILAQYWYPCSESKRPVQAFVVLLINSRPYKDTVIVTCHPVKYIFPFLSFLFNTIHHLLEFLKNITKDIY